LVMSMASTSITLGSPCAVADCDLRAVVGPNAVPVVAAGNVPCVAGANAVPAVAAGNVACGVVASAVLVVGTVARGCVNC
jgi:hypothetical protein